MFLATIWRPSSGRQHGVSTQSSTNWIKPAFPENLVYENSYSPEALLSFIFFYFFHFKLNLLNNSLYFFVYFFVAKSENQHYVLLISTWCFFFACSREWIITTGRCFYTVNWKGASEISNCVTFR